MQAYLYHSNTSVKNLRISQEADGELRDLQSRGLCLVPRSFMLKNDSAARPS
jgi:hypothetical protein